MRYPWPLIKWLWKTVSRAVWATVVGYLVALRKELVALSVMGTMVLGFVFRDELVELWNRIVGR